MGVLRGSLRGVSRRRQLPLNCGRLGLLVRASHPQVPLDLDLPAHKNGRRLTCRQSLPAGWLTLASRDATCWSQTLQPWAMRTSRLQPPVRCAVPSGWGPTSVDATAYYSVIALGAVKRLWSSQRGKILPWATWPVQMEIWVRRLFCETTVCPRRTFS